MRFAAGLAVALAGCVHVETVAAGRFSLEPQQYAEDQERVSGLAIPTLRCPRAEQQLQVLDAEGDQAELMRVSCRGKSLTFQRCRWLQFKTWRKQWIRQGAECPPEGEERDPD